MESMFRILALSTACLLFAVSSGHAACYNSAFKLEKDKKEKNIDQILAYGHCIKAEQRTRVGEWVCQVSGTAGMKVDEQRRVISDRVGPANERFFVTIQEVSDAEKRMRCDESEYGLIDNLDGSRANRCLINYDVEFSPSTGKFLGSTDTYNFQRDHGKFTLYGTNHFSLFEGETGEFLVSLGACEKLN
ncbi:hypothetical protein [Bradyrhizobium sp. JYMT SZCCT0428]|uniref:hypothetical protein n=1 Tax=Bradyrhizobium sp. JYMT SZCCT0428 TaxID=2807673 RepID=UPI001BA7733A|nr:hypothetical protein [Bradyrhizobium sp. JYMT SZCCT0428]MBR1157248.1 hypothetical protein [Bradyrhizobium sp. JYMT SZCCT0428]